MGEQSHDLGPWWRKPLLFYSKLNGWIIGPFLVAFLAGRWLDGKLDTDPWITIISITSAFVFSTFEMVKIAKEEMKNRR